MDLEEIRNHLRRVPWENFPDVYLFADIAAVKGHPLYADAKAGDPRAADGLVQDILSLGIAIPEFPIGETEPHLLAVHAVETAGMNAIPRAFARALGKGANLPVAEGIIQINRVMHTGADGYHRLANQAVFEGDVSAKDYILVDDFVGQGGTIANLRGHVEAQGGRVIHSVVLCGKAYSARLRLEQGTLDELRKKHGRELEEWWTATFGFGFERLTESEARYLTRSENADIIRARIVAAGRTGDR